MVLKFGENEKIAKEVSWLIENHLLLSEFGFKKDIEDYSIIKKISKKVDTLERLKGIYLLTVCDISAVDHGIWNDWKATLLEKLYLKIKDEIKKPKKGSLNKKIEDIKNSVLFSSKIINKQKLEKFSKITYPNYWLLQNKGSIKYQIENFFLSENQLAKRFNFVIKKNKRFNFLEIIVVTNDRPSLFLDLITVILSENLSVHEARIFTLDDGMVIDTFIVSYNYNKNFLASEIKRKIDSLNKKFTDLSKGKTLPISYVFKNTKNKIIERNEINFDNKTSSTYTVLEVITNDKPGLLYDISKILLKIKLLFLWQRYLRMVILWRTAFILETNLE